MYFLTLIAELNSILRYHLNRPNDRQVYGAKRVRSAVGLFIGAAGR
jgi:hypothetical protein